MRLCWGTTPTMPGLSRFTSYDSAFTSAPRADQRIPLIRTLTRYSEAGQPRPYTGQAAHMRNRGFTCGTGGSHAGRVGIQVVVARSKSVTNHGTATHPRCFSIHIIEAHTTD